MANVEPLFKQLAATNHSKVLLINNFGAAEAYGCIGDLDYSLAERVAKVNIVGSTVLVDLFCKLFNKFPGQKVIVNTSSGAAVKPIPGASIYWISKAALEMLTMATAEEQKLKNEPIINVGIRPGIIDTPMQTAARSWPKDKYPTADQFLAYFSEGKLIPPNVNAGKITSWLERGTFETGRIYNIGEIT